MSTSNVPTVVCETERLTLRRLTLDDAPFIVRLLNEPSFIRFIGDRGVRSEDDARRYLTNGPLDSYRKHGFGLFAAVRRVDQVPVGICGLLRRDGLDAVDVGFAFLSEYWGKGYACEAGRATLEYGFQALSLPRIVAITALDNDASMRVLWKLGFSFSRRMRLVENGEELNLFVSRPREADGAGTGV